MKKLMKRSLALILTLAFICSGFSVCAVEVNGKQHLDYGSYVLLGDSVASGWSDVEDRGNTSFHRIEGSYGALLADDLQVKEYHPMACIGFRTVEMRYIFEEDYEPDRFIFKSIEDEIMEEKMPLMREAVKNADLITLNIGGNDWGSYVGWHIEEAVAEMSGTENFVEAALGYLEGTVNFSVETIETLVGMADLFKCVPELVQILPGALREGFARYLRNWNYMIEDIYALNPDVTLVVIGMFDTALQDETMKDSENAGVSLPSVDIGINIGQTIVDLANIPMRDGAEKYGYIFVEPVGTLCEKQHPSYAGHRHIADMILEALPDAAFPYTDIEKGTKEYSVAQKLYNKGFMYGVSDTEFAPDAALTKGGLADVLYAVAGAPETDSAPLDTASPSAAWTAEKGIMTVDENGNFSAGSEVSYFEFAKIMFRFAQTDLSGIKGFIKGISLFFSVIIQNIFNISGAISRIDAATYIVNYCGI
ncbi:MAG: S-layer homology domain-containing protein [Clostridia bacterium]|nr:S-layer homology domain-containing protein [Clostridia bacterium]